MLGGTALLLGGAALVGGEPWSAWDTCAKRYARDVSAIFPRHTTDDILSKLPPPTTDHFLTVQGLQKGNSILAEEHTF